MTDNLCVTLFFLRINNVTTIETKKVRNNVRKWPNYALLGLGMLRKLVKRL